MENNTPADGGNGRAPVVDRYFLSVNGSLLGPFTGKQIPKQPWSETAWIWQPGQSGWQPWQPPVGSVPATAKQSDADQAGHGQIAVETSTTSAKRLTRSEAKAQLAAAERDGRQIRLSIGQAIIERSLPLRNDFMANERVLGQQILQRITELDDEIAQIQGKLDQQDHKSTAAAQSRRTLDKRRRQRASLVAQLQEKQHQIGIGSGDDPVVVELLPDLHEKLVKVRKQFEATKVVCREKGIDTTPTNYKAAAHYFMVSIVGSVVLYCLTGKWRLGDVLRPDPAPQPVGAAVQPVNPSATPIKAVSAALPVTGLTRAQLPLSSVYVEVRWQAGPNASGGCSGTASPALLQDDRLVLLTNLHLLDLANLGAVKTGQGLQIRQYQISVRFPSGKVCPVLRFRPENEGRDLMALDVDSRLIQQGVDFVVLPVATESVSVEAGDDVVAVGNPGLGDLTLENTQTFGHVSAVRDDADEHKVMTRYLQTDAAVNHGNSGGPLFVKAADRYWWAGINTMVVGREQGYQGLNFAIDARQAVKLKFMEFEPTPMGMASYLSSVWNFPATAATP